MPRVAHLSDVHILGRTPRRSARYRFATTFVGMGRSSDPSLRARKLLRALEAARKSGAEHVVISGDLTEVGDQDEFEHFAEVLDAAGLPDGSVTLVPGNHDAYTSADAWKRALDGPLRRYAEASAGAPGKIVDRGDIVFLPIDTSCFQSLARASGEFSSAAAAAIDARLEDPALKNGNKAIVLVLHHSPIVRRTPIMQWMDGLRGCAQVLDLLVRHPRVQILHGHLHKIVDGVVDALRPGSGPTRIFGAPATCEDGHDTPARVRLYDLRAGSAGGMALAAVPALATG